MSYFCHFYNKKQEKNPKDPQILSPGTKFEKKFIPWSFFFTGPCSDFVQGQNIIVAPPKIMFFSSADEFFIHTHKKKQFQEERRKV